MCIDETNSVYLNERTKRSSKKASLGWIFARLDFDDCDCPAKTCARLSSVGCAPRPQADRDHEHCQRRFAAAAVQLGADSAVAKLRAAELFVRGRLRDFQQTDCGASSEEKESLTR